MNKPYVKQYDSLGVHTNAVTKPNPILHGEHNRSQRRKPYGRAMNNSRNDQQVISNIGRWKKAIQVISLKGGGSKIIYHSHVVNAKVRNKEKKD